MCRLSDEETRLLKKAVEASLDRQLSDEDWQQFISGALDKFSDDDLIDICQASLLVLARMDHELQELVQ